MKKDLVIKTSEVAPYLPSKARGLYESRLLICPDSVGSKKLGLTHATVKPGASSGEAEFHPPPYDEAYYILHGSGQVDFPDLNQTHYVTADTAVFIPAGTRHRIQNLGADDLVFLGILPLFPAEEGIHPLIDARRKEWGTSFRKIAPSA